MPVGLTVLKNLIPSVNNVLVALMLNWKISLTEVNFSEWMEGHIGWNSGLQATVVRTHIFCVFTCNINVHCVSVDREDTRPSMRCVSSTSHPGLSTGCPITPLDCWPLYEEWKPLHLLMLALWWSTAGSMILRDCRNLKRYETKPAITNLNSEYNSF